MANRRWPQLYAWCAALSIAAACLTGCGPTQQHTSPERTPPAVTPDEAHAQLKQVMLATATAALPDGVGHPAVEDEQVGAPCGGPTGTSFSKVDSTLKVTNGDPNPGRTPVQMRDAAGAYLRAQGWTMLPNEDTAKGAHLGYAKKDGMELEFAAVDGQKIVTVLGNTPCLSNPDPLTNKG